MSSLIEVNGKSITKVVICDSEGEALFSFAPEDERSEEAKGSPIASLAQLAGFINSKLKQKTGKNQPIPTGGLMIIFADSHRVGLVRWSPKPGSPGEREVKVITDRLFGK